VRVPLHGFRLLPRPTVECETFVAWAVIDDACAAANRAPNVPPLPLPPLWPNVRGVREVAHQQ